MKLNFKLSMRLVFVLGFFLLSIPIFSYNSPILSNFRIENSNKNRVYFDVNGDISELTTKGFKISGRTVSSINISSNYFTVTSSFTFWDNNTIRLESGNGVVIDFTLQYIKNNIQEPVGVGNIYYVTTGGNSSNNGLSEQNAWNIEYAVTAARSGDIVYVKSGDYGDVQLRGFRNGTISNPIKFIGYKVMPNDINSMYFKYGVTGSLNASEMPLLNHRQGGTGTAINVGGNYVIIENIQVTNYANGFVASSNPLGVIFKNCIAHTLGRTAGQPGDQGMGFKFIDHDTMKCRILNSIVVNASIDNFIMYGNFNSIEGCESYCDRDDVSGGEATDYYFILGGSNSLFLNNHMERNIDNTHNGHGITWRNSSLEQPVHYNLAQDCTIVGIGGSIEFRHWNIKYNVARNITITGGIIPKTSKYPAYGPIFRDGASYNSLENCSMSGMVAGIRFRNTGEEDKLYPNQLAGEHNKIVNCIIDDCTYGVWGAEANPAKNNEIINTTFNDLKYLYYEKYSGGNYIFSDGTNFMKNCIINNVTTRKIVSGASGFVESFNNYYGGFAMPNGEGNISVDPQFVDISNNNFQLKSTSRLIDAGKSFGDIGYDYNGEERFQGSSYDIGAFEYQDNSSSSVIANAGSDQTICAGGNATLTASGGATYLWSTGATSKSITVNPSSTKTYTVTVSDGSSSDSDDVIVIVNNVTASAGADVSIEEGNSILLTASGGDEYSWDTGETTKSITVKPNETKSYTVTVTKNGCQDSDQVTVTVNSSESPSITANAGADQDICLGESATLSASGGTSYKWSTGATSKSITVKPSSTKTYTVTVSDGTNSDSDDVTIIVNNVIANAGTDKTIEEGQSVKLTAAGGDSYKWSNGAITKSINVSPTTSKKYTVTVSKNGCTDADDVNITVNSKITNPPPAVAFAGDDISICLGESVVLNASGGSSYVWSTGDTDGSIDVSPTRTTVYTLSATRGGVTDTDTVTVSVENCNITTSPDPELDLNDELVVYPNPTRGNLNISLKNTDEDFDIFIIDLKGSIVYRDKLISSQNEASKQLDLSNLVRGVYFVRLINSNRIMVKKVIHI